MFNFEHFSLRDMTDCSAGLRTLGEGAETMGEVAEKTVRFLYDNIDDGSGGRACALVRLFKTHRIDELDRDLREFAQAQLGGYPAPADMKCLVLLGTAGAEPEWNQREQSAGHRAIPMPSPEFVRAFPMISMLFSQFGVELNELLKPEPSLIMDLAQTTFNVFYVPEAPGSPYVPAQAEFVVPYGIKSVLGFGSVLPKGDVFAVILFSKYRIPRTTVELIKPLALSVKVALLSSASSKLLVR